MKAVILAAGYGTRLQKDLQEEPGRQHHLLLGKPKPLLTVGGVPLLTRWVQQLREQQEMEEIVVVTNKAFYNDFLVWAEGFQGITLLCDNSIDNNSRLGAVACMDLAVTSIGHHSDTLFIAGDTLFPADFSLDDFLAEYHRLQKTNSSSCLVVSTTVSEENVSKHGIIEVNSLGKVTAFLEKPKPSKTSSRLQCPCFYLFSSAGLDCLSKFLSSTSHLPLSARDATGNFVAFLIQHVPVFAFPVSARYDIGGLATYMECDRAFTSCSTTAGHLQ